MARSLRSKSRRKLMRIKRVRYGRKELIRLKKMLGLPTGEEGAAYGHTEVKIEPDATADTTTSTGTDVTSDEVMVIPNAGPSTSEDGDWVEVEDDIAEVIKMKRTHKIRASHRPRTFDGKRKSKKHSASEGEVTSATGEEEPMDHDQRRRFNRQTQRDQYGNYPSWMNQKTVKKLAKKSKKIKRAEKKSKFTRLCKKGLRKKYSKETMQTEAVGLNEAITQLTKFVV